MEKPDLENSGKISYVTRQQFGTVLTIIVAAFLLAFIIVQAQMSNLRLEVRSVQLEQKKYAADKAQELQYLIEIKQTMQDLDVQIIEAKRQANP